MHRPDRALAVLAALSMSMHPRTQTAIIIARPHSKTARILHSIKNLFWLRRLLHRRIPYNPPPKRWRAHSLKQRLPELASSNFNVRSSGERMARNTPIQGTAADVIKLAMVRVWKRLRNEKMESRLILTVHDELIVDCLLYTSDAADE